MLQAADSIQPRLGLRTLPDAFGGAPCGYIYGPRASSRPLEQIAEGRQYESHATVQYLEPYHKSSHSIKPLLRAFSATEGEHG